MPPVLPDFRPELSGYVGFVGSCFTRFGAFRENREEATLKLSRRKEVKGCRIAACTAPPDILLFAHEIYT